MSDHASMNRAYRLVWSDRLNAYVVAAETARGRGQRAVRSVITSLLAGVIAAGPVQAQSLPPPAATQLPTGGKLVAGQAGITQNGARLDVTQTSHRAAIEWQTFNVGANAHVNFNQPGAQSVILNRVLDAQPSQIFGRITANGQVFLTNPNGVYFSPTASVDVGGLAATTHSISVADFMAGKSTFQRNGAAGAVVNQGNLKASLGGYIALLAPHVRNEGVVVAQAGTAALAAGESITLNFSGANTLAGITVTPSQIKALVDNRHAVLAPGGLVILSAQAADRLQGGVVRNSGTLEAQGLTQRGGRIVLEASDRIESSGVINASAASGNGGSIALKADYNIEVTGSLRATSAAASGGSVTIEGDSIRLASTSQIDASGATGGGTVLVGGDWQGSGPMAQASRVVMDKGAIIDVSATRDGDGGKAVLWSSLARSNGATEFNGLIRATGATGTRAGGQVETSGHSLGVSGTVVTGRGGQWLLDPYNVNITNGASSNVDGSFGATGSPATVLASSIASALTAGSDVTVTTGTSGNELGRITVNADIITGAMAGDATLTLKAEHNVVISPGYVIDATQNGNSNKLHVVLWANATDNGRGGVALGSNAAIRSNGGNITLGGGSDLLTGYATGPINGVNGRGIWLLDGTVLNAGGGNISLRGMGKDGGEGIALGDPATGAAGGSVLVTHGSGTITLVGVGTTAVASQPTTGIKLHDNVRLQTANGAINLRGTGGNTVDTTSDNSGILLGPNSRILSAGGPITLAGDVGSGISTEGSGIRALAGGVNYIGHDGGTNLGAATGDITFNADALRMSGATTKLNTSGALTFAPNNTSFATAFDWSGTMSNGHFTGAGSIDGLVINNFSGISALALGRDGDVSGLTISGEIGPVPLLTLSSSGMTTQTARVQADNLQLNGTGGDYLLNHSENRIGTLAASVDTGSVVLRNATPLLIGTVDRTSGITSTNGSVYIETASGQALTVNEPILAPAPTLIAGGDLTLNAGVTATLSDLQLSAEGRFVNNAGANALATPGRWLVYSNSPHTNTFGGLVSGNGGLFGKRAADYGPGDLAADGYNGNRYLFATNETITVTTLNAGSTYGDVPPSLANRYTVAPANTFGGVILAPTISGTPVISSAGASVTAHAGSYAVSANVSGMSTNVPGYHFAPADTGVFTVAPRPLTLSGNRVYDATTSIAAGLLSLGNIVNGDAVTMTGSGVLSSKNVGTQGLNSSGTLALSNGDYTLIGASAAVTITPAALAVTGVTAQNKVYDATTGAVLSGTAQVAPLSGDTVSLGGNVLAQFSDKHAGGNKAVSVSGYTLLGGDAGNYVIQQPAGLTATISPAALAVTGITAQNKVYDATTAAVLSGTAQVAPLAGDLVSLGGNVLAQFSDKHVGGNKAVSVSGYTLLGGDAGNYVIQQPAGLAATISPAALAVTGVTAQNKVYDATTATVLSGTAQVAPLAGDLVSLGGNVLAQFSDKHVGGNKAVSVSGYTLLGGDAGNYVIQQPAGLAATISPAALAVTGVTAQNKVYDATTATVLSGTAQVAPLAGDLVSLGGNVLAQFSVKHVGGNKAVSVSGYTLLGGDAGNYVIQQPAGLTATISPAALAVTGLTAQNKVYDATTTAALSGSAQVAPLTGDVVSLAGNPTARFGDKLVGNDKTVTVSGYTLQGADAGNYVLAAPAALTAHISPATLHVTGIAAQNKVYDGTVAATLSGSAAVMALGADTVTLAGNAVARFDDATVGNNKPVSVSGYALAGADAANYVVGQPAGLNANIFAAPAVPAAPVATPARLTVPVWPPLPMTESRGDLMQLAVQGSGATLDESALLPVPVIVAEASRVLAGETRFSLPAALQAVLVAGVSRAVVATRMDRAPLPYWLKFDAAARAFVAAAIPPNALPMRILLTLGTQRHVVEIALPPARTVANLR